jgi:RimJ/RimL family protein N-acetyltransferase
MAPKPAPEIDLIKPFPPEAYPRVWTWLQDFKDRVLDDFSPQDLPSFVTFCIELAKTAVTWGVLRNGELIGLLTFEPVNGVTGIAHAIFRKDAWGRQTTVPAITEAAESIFASGVRKVEFPIFADNHAVEAMLLKLGAVREGLLREHSMRGGKPIDMIVIGITREDFDVWKKAGNA